LIVSFPAQAQQNYPFALQMTGGQFLALCTNPPSDSGPQVVAMCRVYVAGIADGLKADNRICFGPWVTQYKLFSAAAWWIDSRPREGYPAGLMIRNGLLNAFPCASRPRLAYGPPSDYRVRQGEAVVRAMTIAKELLLLFGIK
jgi:hypothetical protein